MHRAEHERRRPTRARARGPSGRRGPPSFRAAARHRRGSGAHPTPATNAATRSSPCMPPSRYSYVGTPATRGVITNGGFDTIRSNCSPATGSNREPRRVSIPSTSFSSALSRVNRSARSDTSVATTCAMSRRARSDWMPHPAPRSRPRPTGVDSCSPARVSDAPPTPSTWSSGSAPPSAASSRSLAIHHWPEPRSSANDCGRMIAAGRTLSPSTAASPSRTSPSTPVRGSAAATESAGCGIPSTKSRPSTASGSVRSPSARAAGALNPRAIAVSADAPHAARSSSEPKCAALRSAASARHSAGSGSGITAPFNPLPAPAPHDRRAPAWARHGVLGGSDRRIAPDRAVMNRTGAKPPHDRHHPATAIAHTATARRSTQCALRPARRDRAHGAARDRGTVGGGTCRRVRGSSCRRATRPPRRPRPHRPGELTGETVVHAVARRQRRRATRRRTRGLGQPAERHGRRDDPDRRDAVAGRDRPARSSGADRLARRATPPAPR